MDVTMNSCELVSLVTAISCGIAKSVPLEDLPEVASIFSQISTTLATIAVNEEILKRKNNNQEITPITPAPDADVADIPTL